MVRSPRKAQPWQRELEQRQCRWREERGYPIGVHNGQARSTRLAMPLAEQGLWNFLTPAIGKLVQREYLDNAARPHAQQKLYGYPRLFDNLLSSQPLAFNLFGELALDLATATRAGRGLWPGRVDTVTRIEFEWSPGRRDQRYLGNKSAADVAIFHTTPSGGAGVIFIETKYYEDMRRDDSVVQPRYLEVANASGAFVTEALPSLQRGKLQRLWLDHLLLLATRQTDALDSALVVVAYPEINQRCHDTVEAYRTTLAATATTTFEPRTYENIATVLGESTAAEWVSAFCARYLAT